ncbi:hypothetical protein [Deinococcus sp. Leaf326]|uniref:hypothetical protein n=1 Tax=Deinococcus sp. Leaf326 TaxID=1736338 RepID=UPI0006F604A3|nr:hypothetical protein [Deinococcus sp. Leaf326]KQR22903.1 hypothetical protein ASF71_06970 [Deinococcus sp. Leaf326]
MKTKHGMKWGPTDTSRPRGLGAFTIRALPCPAYTGKGKTRQVDPTKPPVLKLVGYYTTGKTPNWSRLKEYQGWKDHVRAAAPPVPQATDAAPVRVDVWCYFASGTHADPENVRKGIVDALFPGGDKYVYGYHHHPLYSDAPHVLVEVSGGVF